MQLKSFCSSLGVERNKLGDWTSSKRRRLDTDFFPSSEHGVRGQAWHCEGLEGESMDMAVISE